MAKRVVLKLEARQVGTKLVMIGEECSLPDHLAAALEDKGLCMIIRPAPPTVEVETKAIPAPKRKAKAKGK